MRILHLFIIFACLIASSLCFGQLPCGQNFDLNTWSQEGNLNSGNWNVLAGGNSVEQVSNGESTWFVSPDDYINVLIQGSITVNTSNDDDLVGFVFGYQSPFGPLTSPSSEYLKTFFFDWKQISQNFMGMDSFEGFALYEYDGFFDFTNIVTSGGAVYPELWQRQNSPNITVLDSDYGNNGWNDFQQYNFQLKYTTDSIVIWIDNNRIFEETGCFEPGRFGFYNKSQDAVVYSDFSYDFEYDFNVSDTLICINETVDFEVGLGCQTNSTSTVDFNWSINTIPSGQGENNSHQFDTAGDYTIELISSDNMGCVDTSSRLVRVLDYPIAEAGPNDTACSLLYDLSALQAIGTGTWSSPENALFDNINDHNTIVTAANPGTQTFFWEVVNEANCSTIDSISVYFNENYISGDISHPTCYDFDDGEIIVSLNSFDSTATYLWNGTSINDNSNQITGLSAGTYTLQVIDDLGCVYDTNFLIIDPDSITFDLNTSNTICDLNNGSAILENIQGGSGSHLINWSNGSTGDTIVQNLGEGDYWISVSDTNGCISTDTFTIESIPFETVIDSSSNATCFGQNNGYAELSVPGSSLNYNYFWTDLDSNETSPTQNNLSAGLYQVIISSSSNCSDTLTIEISEPTPIFVSQIVDTSICSGNIVSLNIDLSGGTSPYTINWEGYDTNESPIVSPETDQNYPVQIVDSNNCEFLDTARVEILQSPEASFMIDDTVSCLAPSPLFNLVNTSTGGVSFSWFFSDGITLLGDSIQRIFNSVGLYSVELIATNEFGCTDTMFAEDLIEITANPEANFSYSPSSPNSNTEEIIFSDLSSGNICCWEWEFNDVLWSTEENPVLYNDSEIVGNNTVNLLVTDYNGCIDTITRTIVFTDEISIYAPNTFTPDGNEFNQYWRIYATGIKESSFEVIVYNRWGEKIWESRDINIPWDGTYKGALVNDGTYPWTIKVKQSNSDNVVIHNGHVNILR